MQDTPLSVMTWGVNPVMALLLLPITTPRATWLPAEACRFWVVPFTVPVMRPPAATVLAVCQLKACAHQLSHSVPRSGPLWCWFCLLGSR